MSLERTALRIGMVMALSNAMQTPFPTVAQDRVYDSRIDPFQGLTEGDIAPLAIVYTDDDDRESLSGNNGGPPWRQSVNLVIELSMGMVGNLVGEDGNPMLGENNTPLSTFLPIATEPQLEAMLDLFEEQVERLFRQPPNAWANRLIGTPEALVVRVESWSSKRYVEREAQYRFAARQIMLRVMLPQPPFPDIVETAPADPPAIPPPLGPLLDAIIADNGPYAPDAEVLAEMLAESGNFGPLVLAPLKRIRIKESNSGGGKRPDGVAQANFPET
jgi:hypothetical protein